MVTTSSLEIHSNLNLSRFLLHNCGNKTGLGSEFIQINYVSQPLKTRKIRISVMFSNFVARAP
jgi:hypothetical protein